MSNTKFHKHQSKRLKKLVLIWIMSSLLIKLIIVSNLNSGIWLGADGESYLNGARAILRDGIYWKDSVLQYWPAGYPMVIALLAKISTTYALSILSITQSLMFAFSCWYFGKVLFKTSVNKHVPTIIFFLSFCPTLALSSLCVGYESLVASVLLLIASLIFRMLLEGKSIHMVLPTVGILSSLMVFLQPRYILVSLIWIVIFVILTKKPRQFVFPLIFSLALILVLPGFLALRNHEASGSYFVSTNLGTTMNIGAGSGATGGYVDSGSGVNCEGVTPSDSELVKCVISWYLNNPKETVRLAWNKSLYFWSPWYGPNANGTMARNPWLRISPVVKFAESDSGRNIVFGQIGKVISTFWTIGNLLLMITGLFVLRKMSESIRNIWWIFAIPIFVSWVLAIGTIGDHRFRLPIMSFVIILELFGLVKIAELRRMRDLNPR